MVPGYRSPLRPIPVDVIKNSLVGFNSFGTVDHEQLVDDALRLQLVNDNQAQKFPSYEDDIADSPNGSWLLEALKAVEDVENKHRKTELSTMVSNLI